MRFAQAQKVLFLSLAMVVVNTTILVHDSLSDTPDYIKTSSDVNGDGLSDLFLYDSSTATFTTRSSATGRFESVRVGSPGNVPASGDFNNDGQTDLATFNRSSGLWHFRLSDASEFSLPFGSAGDLPVPGKFHGNSCTDVALFNPSTATWMIANCKNADDVETVQLGDPGSLPLVGDFDGDGVDDIGTFNRASATWTVRESRTRQSQVTAFGLPGDIPMPADFLGKGKADFVVYRPTDNHYYVKNPFGGEPFLKFAFGLPGDIPSLVDVDGDARADMTVFSPRTNTFSLLTSNGSSFVIPFPVALPLPSGTPNRVAAPSLQHSALVKAVAGDFNRNNRSDIAIVDRSKSVNSWAVTGFGGNSHVFNYGLPGDTLLSGDTNGDLVFEPTAVRDRGDGFLVWLTLAPGDGISSTQFGINGDKPVFGDVDCDGKDDLLVVRALGQQLYWFALTSTGVALEAVPYGLAGDGVFAADTNGDGCDEIGIARQFVGNVLWATHSPLQEGVPDESAFWGLEGLDQALPPMDFNGDGRDDFNVVRTEGEAKTAFIRFSGDSGSSSAIALGNKAVPVAGHYSGHAYAQMGALTSADGRTGFVTVYNNSAVPVLSKVVALSSNNALVTPYGNAIALEDLNPIGCNVERSFRDGSGGKLYKPSSDGVPGHPVVLFNKSYASRVGGIEIYNRDNRHIGGSARTKCCPNGNRFHMWLDVATRTLATQDPLTLKLKFRDGTNECYEVPNARSRID